ncbi:MAG: DUF3857 domain-containing protein [Bacteroidota bacterium]
MRVLVFLTAFFLLTNVSGKEKDPKYPAANIPEELKEDANAVFRLNRSEFVIEGMDRARLKVHVAVTLLNEKAKRYGWVVIGYDKLRKVTHFEARSYDAAGQLIRKMKKDDIIDESSISSGSLYDDSRLKGTDLSHDTYPYTVEYEYEVLFKYLYQIPNWYVLPSSNISVQKSEYIVKSPTGLEPRFKVLNTDQKSETGTDEDGKLINSWVFKNVKAYESEVFSRGSLDLSPIIYCAPSKFKYEDYEGDMSTWDGLAAWQNSLNYGRNELPEATKATVKDLVKDLNNDTQKIKAIYEFMQSRTRYVSVQLGIGGFQPFEAKVVDEVGYGDCKALSFYTQSLLSAVGIKSYYTWVEAGSYPEKVYPDFPNDTFNHIILCVPNKGDTIWLECTNQSIPFGFLGSFTSDRDVLVIQEDGAEIVKTPTYDSKKNLIRATGTITLDKEGNAAIASRTHFFGEAYDYRNLDYTIKLSKNDQEDWLKRYLDIPNYEINAFSFSEKKDILPSIDLALDVNARSLASKSGKRYFFTTDLFTKMGGIPKIVEPRKSKIHLNSSRVYVDSLVFRWPETFKVEQLPDNVEIQSEFGSYRCTYSIASGSLTYTREVSFTKGVFPAERYQDLFKFFRKIQRTDRKKILLLDKT